MNSMHQGCDQPRFEAAGFFFRLMEPNAVKESAFGVISSKFLSFRVTCGLVTFSPCCIASSAVTVRCSHLLL